jgi:hypothetical protein
MELSAVGALPQMDLKRRVSKTTMATAPATLPTTAPAIAPADRPLLGSVVVALAGEPVTPVTPPGGAVTPVAPPAGTVAPVAPPAGPVTPVTPPGGAVTPVTPPAGTVAPVTPPAGPVTPVTPPGGAVTPVTPSAGTVEPVTPPGGAVTPVTPPAGTVAPVTPVVTPPVTPGALVTPVTPATLPVTVVTPTDGEVTADVGLSVDVSLVTSANTRGERKVIFVADCNIGLLSLSASRTLSGTMFSSGSSTVPRLLRDVGGAHVHEHWLRIVERLTWTISFTTATDVWTIVTGKPCPMLKDSVVASENENDETIGLNVKLGSGSCRLQALAEFLVHQELMIVTLMEKKLNLNVAFSNLLASVVEMLKLTPDCVGETGQAFVRQF